MVFLDAKRRSSGESPFSRVGVRVSGLMIVPLMLTVFVGSAAGGGAASRIVSASSPASTGWKSKPIHWTDIQTLAEGGKLVYRATNIRLGGDSFAVTASV